MFKIGTGKSMGATDMFGAFVSRPERFLIDGNR
jgi:hypothetical protein